jgi:hypothetical protein
MPSWLILDSFNLVRSVSKPNSIFPLSGFVRPVMRSSMELLPAPFGPMITRNSPWSIYKVRFEMALKPSKDLFTSSSIKINLRGSDMVSSIVLRQGLFFFHRIGNGRGSNRSLLLFCRPKTLFQGGELPGQTDDALGHEQRH